MHSWLKTLWEKLDLFYIQMEFHDSPIKMGWERKKWLILDLTQIGHLMHAVGLLNVKIYVKHSVFNVNIKELKMSSKIAVDDVMVFLSIVKSTNSDN